MNDTSLQNAAKCAALALLHSIEAAADAATNDARTLDSLSITFRRVHETLPAIADASNFGAQSDDAQTRLEALSGFYEGVRHLCGLEGTNTEALAAPEHVRKTLEAVTALYQKVKEVDSLRARIDAIPKHLTAGAALSFIADMVSLSALLWRGDESQRVTAGNIDAALRKCFGEQFAKIAAANVEHPSATTSNARKASSF